MMCLVAYPSKENSRRRLVPNVVNLRNPGRLTASPEATLRSACKVGVLGKFPLRVGTA
jgi:hypothetical protein